MGKWTGGGVTRERARAGLDVGGLETRYIVVKLVHRSETMDADSEEVGEVVQSSFEEKR